MICQPMRELESALRYAISELGTTTRWWFSVRVPEEHILVYEKLNERGQLGYKVMWYFDNVGLQNVLVIGRRPTVEDAYILALAAGL